MIEVKNISTTDADVYDISLDGTVVNALGLNICSNTDGFNFELPDSSKYRYTEEHPYISSGLSRETKKGKAYTGFDADLAEFNDTYMRDFHYSPNAVQRMGLGLDEIITGGSIQLGRKNYIDYFPEKPLGKDLKLVGNTMKSKKMPLYIKIFIDNTVRLLLNKKGKEFIEEYYSYIERIYNYQIPLRQIASKGKVKKTLKEYVEDCKTVTKAGTTKARQSWMELALKNNLDVHLGETLYYINTGTSKSHADVKKVTHYYRMENGLMGLERKDCKVMVEKEYKMAPDGKNTKLPIREWVTKHYPEITVEDEIILNCELVPREIIDSDKEFYCEEGKEYNVAKYIEQFNKRITPLLVCFKRDVRSRILVTNPKDRGYFTDEECVLISGEPNKPGDQDTYEALMTMDDREIRFWMNHPEWEIPFLKETGMDWDKIVKDYNARMEREKELGINKVREVFEKAMDKMTNDEYIDLVGDLVLPSCMSSFVTLDKDTGKILSKDYPDITIAMVSDVIDYRYQKDLIGNNENPEDETQGVEP